MTPSDAEKYFAKTYRNSNTKFNFVEIIQANSNFYMYSKEQLYDIWDALDAVYEIAIND